MSTTMPTNTLPNAPATTAIKADHEIKITLKDGHAVAPSSIFAMAVGETVCYASDDGEVRILFRERSPFRTDVRTMTSVPGSVILTLAYGSPDGIMEGDCFITPSDGTEVGYDPEHPSPGVHHRVTPPAAP
jgi:hypothetical protein